MSLSDRLVQTQGPPAVILIRLLVGAVFLSEGIQKFLLPEDVGAGRFARIGIPMPELFGPFVGAVEITCGMLVLLGLLTRVAVVPLIVIMFVAIGSTKIPIMLDRGFWAMAHESRTDFSMLMGSIFLIIVGGGKWSLDAVIHRRSAP